MKNRTKWGKRERILKKMGQRHLRFVLCDGQVEKVPEIWGHPKTPSENANNFKNYRKSHPMLFTPLFFLLLGKESREEMRGRGGGGGLA